MRKPKKMLIIGLLLLFILLLMERQSVASNLIDGLVAPEYTQEFKDYLELTEDERKERIQPRMFKLEKTNIETKNPFRLVKSKEASLETRFSLKDVIADNVIIRDQQETNACWTFATLSSLETNLALIGNDTSKIYDFSERHMEYATSRFFLNNTVNIKGLNRNVGDGGNWNMAVAYLTNGQGAIDETSMLFKNNEDTIDISEIQNKTVTSEIYDTVSFASYNLTDDITEIKQQMKEHIKSYGSIYASIYGASLFSDYYNNETGAIYCDDADKCQINHAVSIIGWDDNYEVKNFNEEHRPTSKGAWIIRNSWGDKIECSLTQMKETIFATFPSDCASKGWTEASQIPDEFAKEFFVKNGYTIENDIASLKVGDNGYMYISYEDVNIYSELSGIEKSSNSIDYENIYQYDDFGAIYPVLLTNVSKTYIGNIFEKKTLGKEYLTQVALTASEAYTCTVYVNPNGKSMAKSDLQQVKLKAGSSESFNVGYHTLEFANPIEITSDEFAVVIEIQGTRTNQITFLTEVNIPKSFISDSMYDLVEIESGKCFCTVDGDFENNTWQDLSQLSKITNGEVFDVDSSIKAFTVSHVEEDDPPTTPDDEKDDPPTTIPEDKKAKNSNFDNVQCDIKSIKYYSFTDTSKKEYVEMEVEVNGITRNLNNDNYEYYYYLSPNETEENIENWVKITQTQSTNNKLIFTINSNDIKNYTELSNSNTLYLYVKEVVTKGEEQSVAVSKSMLMESNITIETYVDNAKVNTADSNNNGKTDTSSDSSKDTTVATMKLPNTGIKLIAISIVIIGIVGIGVYIRYKSLSKYVK